MGFDITYFFRWNQRIVTTNPSSSGGGTGAGAISTVIDTNLAPNWILASDAAGKIIVSNVSVTQGSFLIGVTSAIQGQLNGKEPTLTKGNLTESTSSVLTIMGGTASIIGSGASIQVKVANTSQSGYLTSTDWNTFNGKQSTALNTGYVFIGNASNVATGFNTITTGDILANSTTGLTIKNSVVLNAQISASAAIARSKTASGTAYRILANNSSGIMSENAALTASQGVVIDGNGQLVASTSTAAQVGYLSTTTGDVQVSMDNKIVTRNVAAIVKSPTVAQDFFAIAWDNTANQYTLVDPVLQGQPTGGFLNQFLGKNSATNFDSSWNSLVIANVTDVTATFSEINTLSGITSSTAQLNYLNTATSDIQAQLNGKQSAVLGNNSMWVGNSSNNAVGLPVGSNGQILTVSGGTPTWVTAGSGGTVTSINVSGGTTGLIATGGPISTTGTITLAGTVNVVNGGTGLTSTTTYAVLAGGTTSTGALQQVSGVGTSGQVLTSNGAGALPTWQSTTLSNPLTTTGDIIYGVSSTPMRLGIGATDSFLQVVSGIPAWSTNFLYTESNNVLKVGAGITSTGSGGTRTDNFFLGLNHSDVLNGGSNRWNNVFGEQHTISNTGHSIIDAFIYGAYYNKLSALSSGDNISQSGLVGGLNNIIETDNSVIIFASIGVGGWLNRIQPSATYAGQRVIGNVTLGGSHNLSDGYGSLASGYWSQSSGYHSFTHGDVTSFTGDSFGGVDPTFNNNGQPGHTGTVPKVKASGRHAINISANSGAQTNGFGALADYSGILFGYDHHIPSDSPQSAIIGGSGIIARATDPNQVYVPNFNIFIAPLNDDALTQILVRDATTGQIKYRNVNSLSITGLTTNRIPYATSSTSLGDSANFTWDNTNNAITIAGTLIHSKASNTNIFIGNIAGNFTLSGTNNIAFGRASLGSLTTGARNTALGSNTLQFVTTGADNVAVGSGAINNTSFNASQNVVIGSASSGNITTGSNNTIIGYSTASSLTTGGQNVIIGSQINVQSGTASGQLSIQNIIFGTGNTATGTTISTGFIGIGVASPTAKLHLAGSTTSAASLNVTSGTAPTSPNDGDIWYDGTNIKMRVGGTTKTFTLV